MSTSVDHVSHRDFGLSVDACARMYDSLVVQLDEAGRCAAVSQNAVDILGCSASDVEGRLLVSLLCADDSATSRVQDWLSEAIESTRSLDEVCQVTPHPKAEVRRLRLRGAVTDAGMGKTQVRWLSLVPCHTGDTGPSQVLAAPHLDRDDVLELYRVVRKASHDLNNALTAYHCFSSVVFGDDADQYSHSVNQLARVISIISDQARALTEVCNRIVDVVIPE
ncbi:MAG: PAS domain-containing protein [Planctomycetaceae bacterium]